MSYELINIYDFKCGDQVVYWPVMARPGRQRLSKCAFVNPGDAMDYGARLEQRYERFVMWIFVDIVPIGKTDEQFISFDAHIKWIASSLGVPPELLG
jgi:hypothetical protein